MILKIFSPKNLATILFFFAQTTARFCKNLIVTLVFEKKRQFFRRKFAKIAENCDYNIDPFWESAMKRFLSIIEKNLLLFFPKVFE
jgi:hypothetical protein